MDSWTLDWGCWCLPHACRMLPKCNLWSSSHTRYGSPAKHPFSGSIPGWLSHSVLSLFSPHSLSDSLSLFPSLCCLPPVCGTLMETTWSWWSLWASSYLWRWWNSSVSSKQAPGSVYRLSVLFTTTGFCLPPMVAIFPVYTQTHIRHIFHHIPSYTMSKRCICTH